MPQCTRYGIRGTWAISAASPPFPATCYHTMNRMCEDSARQSGPKYCATRPGRMQRKSASAHFPDRPRKRDAADSKKHDLSGPAIFVLLLTLGCGTSGCGSPASSSQRPARMFEGQTVRVACPVPTAAAVVQRYSQSWSLQTGARVEVVPYDLKTGPAQGPA